MYNLLKLTDIKILEIEGSSYCNAGCPYCARHLPGTSIRDTGFTQTHLTLDVFKKAVSDLGNHAHNMECWFVGNLGDAIMNPDILSMWQIAVDSFKSCEIETNGGLRSKEFWKQMGKVGYQANKKNDTNNNIITFSIDGLEDTNEIYRKKVNWNKLIDNVKSYIDAGGTAHWKWLTFEHNEHQIEEAKALGKSLGFRKFITTHSTRYAEQQKEKEFYDKLSDDQRTVGLKSDIEKIVEQKLNEVDYYKEEKMISCKNLKTKRMYLNAKGKVWPCCWHSAKYDKYDDLREMDTALIEYYKDGFNDLATKSLQEIFSSQAWVDLTGSWETSAINKNTPFQLCAKKCKNDKWQATCAIRQPTQHLQR